MTVINLKLVNKPHLPSGTTRPARGRRPTYKPLLFAMHVICLAEARRQSGEGASLEDLVAEASKDWSISDETARSYIWNARYNYSTAQGLVAALLDCPGIEQNDVLLAVQQHMPSHRGRTVALAPNGVEFNVNPYLRSIHPPASSDDEGDSE